MYIQGYIGPMHDIENCCSFLYICLWLFKYTKTSAVFFYFILTLSLEMSGEPEFLDVPTMRRLYDFWEKNEAKDENGKELFFPKEKHAVFRDLGLFMFMYLGDGQNLADTLRLTYDEWYFATHGKQLRFLRHKTQDRNESASEVIFPITTELRKIIAKYGNEPKLGESVFPIMSQQITADQEVWVIQRYNRYIREHMTKVS